MTPLARVPATEYHFIARALDCGALGVMVPMVDTPEQARLIVSCTRYPPDGRRGAAFGFAHDDYQGGEVKEKVRAIHARTLTICMIETKKGLENVEAIAAVPGVDVLWLGHFDVWTHEGLIMFRQGLMLNGALATPPQCEALLKAAFEACERYYQAFQFVVWAGKDSREALTSTMFETEGRA